MGSPVVQYWLANAVLSNRGSAGASGESSSGDETGSGDSENSESESEFSEDPADEPVKEPEPKGSKHPSDASEVKESGTTASDLPRLSSRSMSSSDNPWVAEPSASLTPTEKLSPVSTDECPATRSLLAFFNHVQVEGKLEQTYPKSIRGDRPLPPVPHFLDSSEAESIMAELAHQEAVLKELQVMEELHAEELELAKLLSRLDLDQPDVDTLPMSWDDPCAVPWVPPVEPLLEDASKLEADSWAELGLHPYDGDGESCDAKPALHRAVNMDEEAPEPPSPAASVKDATMDDCGEVQAAPEPTGSIAEDAIADDAKADESAAEPTGSAAEGAIADDTEADESAAEPTGSTAEQAIADGTEADQAAREPSSPDAIMDGEAETSSAEPAALKPPACLKALMPISPADQTKLLKPDRDGRGRRGRGGRGGRGRGRGRAGRGRCESDSEPEEEDELSDDGGAKRSRASSESDHDIVKKAPKNRATAKAKSKALAKPKAKAAGKSKAKAKAKAKGKAVSKHGVEDEGREGQDEASEEQPAKRKRRSSKESEHPTKKAKCMRDASDDASDKDEEDSVEAGFTVKGSTKLSPASKRAAITKAGGTVVCGRKATRAAEDCKKPTKAAEDRKKSTKTGEDRKNSTKGGEDRKKSTKGGEDRKKSTKNGEDRGKKPGKAGGDVGETGSKSAETKARLSENPLRTTRLGLRRKPLELQTSRPKRLQRRFPATQLSNEILASPSLSI
ncbi:unnamed protein product [Symbiodinium sp. CCMP2592]|nr:unnamed protein product [Symbiodinium sp. CCMP2592]